MNSTQQHTSALDVRQAPAPEAFELPEGIYQPQAEKIREALTHLYESKKLYWMARDAIQKYNKGGDVEELVHFTFEELYRGTTFDAVQPLTGTTEENAQSLCAWARNA